MITKHPKSTPRKSRTKPRKPKYLSLRLQLTATPPPPPPPMSTTSRHDPKQLIDLFPLHPAEKVLDEEHDNMAACIFSSCDDVDGAATTLTGILCSDDDEDDDVQQEQNTNNVPSLSPSELELVRTAMRRNKNHQKINDDHEKWVCYSEQVVERKMKMKTEIVSSSSSTSYHDHKENNEDSEDFDHDDRRSKKLVLKLDYEKIIESWVNKGPLFVHGNSDMDAPQPQTVPDLQDDDIFLPSYINASNLGMLKMSHNTDKTNH